jgi:hypothetical protein
MANKYPYVASAGPVVKAVAHLRKSFPKEVTADTLRKLGVAPQNESYVINVLRFLGIIDDEGKKVDANTKAFVQHDDSAFATEFAKLVSESYEELFELHGAAAWKLDRNALTQFFRTTDHSSDVVGTRQASTFAALAALSGHADMPAPKATSSVPKNAAKTEKKVRASKTEAETHKVKPAGTPHDTENVAPNAVGLTVRIEVNLPASGDQDTYDRIFRSIRENLIDGKVV